MQVTYCVNDGYAGSRPKYVVIDEEELNDRETESEKRQYIEECIEEHFKEHVSWSCDIDKYLKPQTP
jgi:hypothetical protein